MKHKQTDSNGDKINNGYLAVIHYFDGTIRHFGPYESTIQAFRDLEKQWELKILVSALELKKDRPFRPVIGRKYKVIHNRDGITALEISVLEISTLFGKKD